MKHSARERAAKSKICAWRNSTNYSLRQVYTSYSVEKENAWGYCVDMCVRFGGEHLRIISYNRYMFTAGFFYTDKQTGVEMFCYITPTYDVTVEL